MSSTKTTSEQVERKKTDARNIFAIDRDCWKCACDLGLNPAVAYLVLARGTGADNRTTQWSAKAIETHTGIGRDRAPRAIAALVDAGLIKKTRDGRHPIYQIQPSFMVPASETFRVNPEPEFVKEFRPQLVWLCNDLVTASAPIEGWPLLERVRRTRNLSALRLLINLHADQEWGRESGLNWREGGVRRSYLREIVHRTNGWTIYGFRPHARWEIEPTGLPARYGETTEDALATLLDLGAITFVPHLVEDVGLDVEIIHSLGDNSESGVAYSEGEVLDDMTSLVSALVPAAKVEEAKARGVSLLVPARPSMLSVQVIGIARLTCAANERQWRNWLELNRPDWSTHAFEYRQAESAISTL